MSKRTLGFIGVGVLLELTGTVSANAGTSLMLTTGIHLVFLNFFIGLVESGLIAPFSRKTWWWLKVPGIIVLGNYFAGGIGYSLLVPALRGIAASYLAPDPLGRVSEVYDLSFLAMLCWSIVLEWPFVLWALGKRKHRVLMSVLLVVFAQVISYFLILYPMYSNSSNTSLLHETRLDQSLVVDAPDIATIYYLGAADGDLYSIRLNRSNCRRLQELPDVPDSRLLWSRRAGERWWDLTLDPQGEVLLPDFAGSRAVHCGVLRQQDGREIEDLDFPGACRGRRNGEWEVAAGPCYWGYLRVFNKNPDRGYALAMETPIIQWKADFPSMLPGGLVLFQMDDMILLLELRTKRIALLARGRSPLLALDMK